MNLQSWSGGKDSTASIILKHMLGLPPSRIVYCEVMFDSSRNISGELPEHAEFVHGVAIPMFESWGYTVDVVRADNDYISCFHKAKTKSKVPERNGKIWGFPQPRSSWCNGHLKVPPLTAYHRTHRFDTQYIGIAADEPKRLARLSGNKRSLLAEHGYTEAMCYDLCKEYGLLSPIYEFTSRGGCWFCPNQRISELARLARVHPALYRELLKLSQNPNLASECFSYSRTFADIDRIVQFENSQLTLF